MLFLRNNSASQKALARAERKHGKGKSLTVLAYKLVRTVYYMLRRETAFNCLLTTGSLISVRLSTTILSEKKRR
jgi:hypothetical protein